MLPCSLVIARLSESPSRALAKPPTTLGAISQGGEERSKGEDSFAAASSSDPNPREAELGPAGFGEEKPVGLVGHTDPGKATVLFRAAIPHSLQ